MKSNKGFTLIELMIAMTLALAILGVVSMTFITSKDMYRYTSNMNRVQENARFAMHFLMTQIRDARRMGCAPTTIQNNLNNPTEFFQPGNNAVGYAYTGSGGDNVTDWTPNLPAALLGGDVLPYTDVLGITRVADAGYKVGPPYMSTTAASLHIETPWGLSVKDIVMVTDCVKADIFQIVAPANPSGSGTVVHNSGGAHYPGNATADLSQIYGPGSELLRFETNFYYIGHSSNNDPGLFRINAADATGGELVGYIENLELSFGEDTNDDKSVNIYNFADQVADWAKVRSVRVLVTARSPQKIAVGGGFRTQDFSSTVHIRDYRK
jgi:type IV pilus assembly protein PilW